MANFRLDEYEPVDSRIRAFWIKYPNGRLLTDLQRTERPDGRIEWVCRTEAYLNCEDMRPQATGYATEIEGSSMINRSNASENCETSSIGRCLANLGFAAKGKRPSREEMGKAVRQDQRRPLSKSDWEDLIARLHSCNNLGQLKAWSAYAANFAMPDGKRNELLAAFNSHKSALGRKSEVA